MASPSLYAILGDDDYIVREKALKIFEGLAPEFPDDLSREIIDGRADRVEDVERILVDAKSACQTLSLFGGGKLVWINEANFLNQSKTGAAQGSKDALESTKQWLGELGDSKLLLSACPVHRNHPFIKWLKQNSDYEDVAKQEKEEASFRRLVESAAHECGIRFSPGAVEFLSQKIGGHSRLGVEETRKLAAYLGPDPEPVTEQLVLELVPDFGESDFFEASEAFFSNNLEWALDAIDRHFFHAKDARPLLASMQNRNRLLIQLRVLADGGELDANQGMNKSTLEQLGRKHAHHFSESGEKSSLNLFSQHPFFLSRLLKALEKFDTRRLIDLQAALIETFEKLLSHPREEQVKLFRDLAVRTLSAK
ncbi:MAG TPA: DNA polymerase III subunit delta [Opitutae bacterium]|nr:DNA polymerase III subunit delta [Opitutae bacterium]|tara:strand:- start:9 stop:1106 length:1098 start_codon:yes stop_codon:yes gene_type:complete